MGQSFAPLLRDPQQTWKEAAFHVFNRNRDGLVLGHAVRTERYRLVSWRRGWELDGEAVATELYDYEQDPHETRNVADDPDYGEVRSELEALLRAGPADQVPLGDARGSGQAEYVRVSPRDARYFELTDGQPYIPVGFNLVGPPQAEDLERVVDRMAEHGVNYCRIWLDQPLWSVEQKQSGVYEAEQAEQLDRFLKLCRERGIRVKMCVEWFRSILAEWPDPPRKGWFPKPLHHHANGGFYEDMTDFLTSERGRDQFKAKLEWYAGRYGDEPAVFAWELWNEMNAVRGPWLPWTEEMLSELQERFPKNLAIQSLGSFDRDRAREPYHQLCELPDNDVLQVHRYLDLGAQLSVCHGPVDVLAANAVQELRAFQIRKPIILTETGAVKPNHSGPSELYEQDHAGILLHDMLFAPFFAGAAGPGHVWFWRQAIDDPNHWYHFQRFRRALGDIDPPAEAFEPLRVEHPELRIYALRGKTTLLAWCRDRANDWQTEFKQGTPPRRLQGLQLNLGSFKPDQEAQDLIVDAYDPWQDRWQPVPCSDGSLQLPDFERSLVLRIRAAEPDAPAD